MSVLVSLKENTHRNLWLYKLNNDCKSFNEAINKLLCKKKDDSNKVYILIESNIPNAENNNYKKIIGVFNTLKALEEYVLFNFKQYYPISFNNTISDFDFFILGVHRSKLLAIYPKKLIKNY